MYTICLAAVLSSAVAFSAFSIGWHGDRKRKKRNKKYIYINLHTLRVWACFRYRQSFTYDCNSVCPLWLYIVKFVKHDQSDFVAILVVIIK